MKRCPLDCEGMRFSESRSKRAASRTIASADETLQTSATGSDRNWKRRRTRCEGVEGRVERDVHRRFEQRDGEGASTVPLDQCPAWPPKRGRRRPPTSSREQVPSCSPPAWRTGLTDPPACDASGTSPPLRARTYIPRGADPLRCTTVPAAQMRECRPGRTARSPSTERARDAAAPSHDNLVAR